MTGPAPRSNRMLALGVLAAVAVGAIAALLKPSPDVPSTAVKIEAESATPVTDPAALQRRLLDDLIAEAASAPTPAKLPAVRSFGAMLAQKGDRDWIVERLSADDAPVGLRVAIVDQLPVGTPRSAAVADRLLGPLLHSDDDAVRRAALEGLESRSRLTTLVSRRSGVRFGIFPPEIGQGTTLFATRARGGIGWDPSFEAGVWTLRLTEQEGGPTTLTQAIDPSAAIRTIDPAPTPQGDANEGPTEALELGAPKGVDRPRLPE